MTTTTTWSTCGTGSALGKTAASTRSAARLQTPVATTERTHRLFDNMQLIQLRILAAFTHLMGLFRPVFRRSDISRVAEGMPLFRAFAWSQRHLPTIFRAGSDAQSPFD